MRAHPAVLTAAVVCLTACSESFEPASVVRSVRVLAVQAEPPSGGPGTSTHLKMLVYAPSAQEPRDTKPDLTQPGPTEDLSDLQIVWLAGCNNPPGGDYYGCTLFFERIAKQLDGAPAIALAQTGGLGLFGTGPNFEMTFPEDILDSAPRDPMQPVHFGRSHVFFAVCRGEIVVDAAMAGLPLSCLDPDSGRPLGAEHFVRGFTSLFAYEGFDNANPIVNGGTFDGVAIPQVACETDADCGSLEKDKYEFSCATSGQCAPVIPICGDTADSTNNDAKKCTHYPIKPDVDRDSAEPDPTAARNAGARKEILWVNYYANGGGIGDARLINDRNSGWLDSYETEWSAPRRPFDPVIIWSAVHDNRGGTAWWRLEVIVR